MLTDNLGYGELGVYGGGILRGAPTPRIDKLASEGMRLLNFNVEAQCTPSRSALMTGRFSIRSGTYEVPIGGVPDGLTQWEITIAELLSAQGYATGMWGKWHLGSAEDRFPTHQGFDEWYGIPRTYDEAMWPSLNETKGHVAVGRQQAGLEREGRPPRAHLRSAQGREGPAGRGAERGPSANHGGGDHDPRRGVHQAQREGGQAVLCLRFLLVGSHADAAESGVRRQDRQRRLGRLPRRDGLPHRPDPRRHQGGGHRRQHAGHLHQRQRPGGDGPLGGRNGPWRGTYFTAMEGSLRAPFIIRWPGKVPAGRVSNEIVHIVDLYTTLARVGGAEVPKDRPIDGVDQLDFFLGKQETSNREGFPAYVADRLSAVKWRNWKVHLIWQENMYDPPLKLPLPKIINLLTDLKEERDVAAKNSWVADPVVKIIGELEASLKKYPPIKVGTPDPYVPPK